MCSCPKGKPAEILMATSIDEILRLENETDTLIRLSEYVNDRIKRDGFTGLQEPAKHFYRIYWLEAEINNGGFDQYFLNIGEHAQDTVKALEVIGADHTAQLLRDAMSVFPGGLAPTDHDQCQRELLNVGEQREELLNKLDSKFYQYNDPISTLLLAFVKQHKEHF
jgi:hypothetical protein